MPVLMLSFRAMTLFEWPFEARAATCFWRSVNWSNRLARKAGLNAVVILGAPSTSSRAWGETHQPVDLIPARPCRLLALWIIVRRSVNVWRYRATSRIYFAVQQVAGKQSGVLERKGNKCRG